MARYMSFYSLMLQQLSFDARGLYVQCSQNKMYWLCIARIHNSIVVGRRPCWNRFHQMQYSWAFWNVVKSSWYDLCLVIARVWHEQASQAAYLKEPEFTMDQITSGAQRQSDCIVECIPEVLPHQRQWMHCLAFREASDWRHSDSHPQTTFCKSHIDQHVQTTQAICHGSFWLSIDRIDDVSEKIIEGLLSTWYSMQSPQTLLFSWLLRMM